MNLVSRHPPQSIGRGGARLGRNWQDPRSAKTALQAAVSMNITCLSVGKTCSAKILKWDKKFLKNPEGMTYHWGGTEVIIAGLPTLTDLPWVSRF